MKWISVGAAIIRYDCLLAIKATGKSHWVVRFDATAREDGSQRVKAKILSSCKTPTSVTECPVSSAEKDVNSFCVTRNVLHSPAKEISQQCAITLR